MKALTKRRFSCSVCYRIRHLFPRQRYNRILMRTLCTSVLAFCSFAQQRSGAPAGAAQSTAAAASTTYTMADVRANYTKFEYRVPMRDGVKLFTSVYVPKDVFSDSRTYPIMMQRTGYNVAPYGIDNYRANLGPSDLFAREKFIFAYQDIRGRFMSEGKYVLIRPHNPRAPKMWTRAPIPTTPSTG
jgi:hypothetical protein